MNRHRIIELKLLNNNKKTRNKLFTNGDLCLKFGGGEGTNKYSTVSKVVKNMWRASPQNPVEHQKIK